MNNYIGMMITMIIILMILMVAFACGFLSIYRMYKTQKRLLRAVRYQLKVSQDRADELYLDCQTALLLLYDIVLNDGIDLQFKAQVVRSSLCLLGMESGSHYEVGALHSIIDTPDIDKINKLVDEIVHKVHDYDPDNIAFLDPKTFTALERFNMTMQAFHDCTEHDQKNLDIFTTDLIVDPVYRKVKDGVRVELSERAQAMMT